MNLHSQAFFIVSTILSLLPVGGCQPRPQQPPPLPLPTSTFTADYFAGTPLSGPTAAVIPVVEPADALTIKVTFTALENNPATSYAPVGTRAIFVTSTGAGNAVLPAAELTRPASIADLKSPADLVNDLRSAGAGRTTLMHRFTAALPLGVTTAFTAVDAVQLMDLVTGLPTSRSLKVMVSRPTDPAGHPQIALVLKDLLRQRDNKLDLRTELALFDVPAGDKTTTALIVPFRFDDAESKAVAALIEISPGSSNSDHIAATTDCLKQLRMNKSTTEPALATGEANPWSTVIAAVQSLTPVNGRRASLAFLADQTNAGLCEDLAMEADNAVLGQLVASIQTKAINRALQPNEKDIGWLLDHTALELLAQLSDDAANGKGKMEIELNSVLTTHTGEVGRHASTLEDVLRGLSSRQELDNRLLAQNLIFLEDSSPAARVRAFDWLNARHHAPAGYDPLASGKARRAALESAAGTQ